MITSFIEAIHRSPTLVEKVCQQLASLLRDSADKQMKLPAERELAMKLGVSRNVLREATKRLELQGILEIRQGQGTRVVYRLHKPITASLELLVTEERERMRQLFQLRCMIEPHNARFAAIQATNFQIERMEAAHESLIVAPDVNAMVMADMEFHRAIADASGNQIVNLLLESVAELREAIHAKGFRRSTSDRACLEHREILTNIRKRKGDAAKRAMEKHLLLTSKELGFSEKDILSGQ